MAIPGVEFRSDYLDDSESRLSLNALIEAEWQFSLDDWERFALRGAFRPYSAILDGRVIANISVADVTFSCGGQETPAHQIGGVVVAPEFRGSGLIQGLFELVFDSLPTNTLYFLYAHNRVYAFYERFGFSHAAESQFTTEMNPSWSPSTPRDTRTRQLDIWDAADVDLLQARVRSRSEVSDVIAINGHFPLFLFNVLYNDDLCSVRDHIYLIEPLDAIVLYCRGDGRLKLIDVIADEIPSLPDLMQHLPASDHLIEFRYTPDKMGVGTSDTYIVNGNAMMLDRQRLYIRGPFPLATGEYPDRGDRFFVPEMFLF